MPLTLRQTIARATALTPDPGQSSADTISVQSDQARQPLSPLRVQMREQLQRATLSGGSLTDAATALTTMLVARTTLSRAEAEQVVAQDVYAVADAVRVRPAVPELVAALPSGAEQAHPIVPANATSPTEPAAPSLALPSATSDDETTITSPWALPPEEYTDPAAYAPDAAGPAFAPAGSAAAWPSSEPADLVPYVPSSVATVPRPTAGQTALWVGLGAAMAGVGIYLLVSHKKRRA